MTEGSVAVEPGRWHRLLPSLRVAGLAWLTARVVTIVGAWMGTVLMPDRSGHYLSPARFGLANPFFVWDSAWYQNITLNGYHWSGPQAGMQNVAFFPLYPLVTRVFSWPFPNRFEPRIQLLVSWVAFFLALVAFHLLAKLELPDEQADRATFVLALLPGSFFAFMGYSEALFLMCTVLTFLLARQERWWLTGVFAFLSALTRPVGFLLFVPLALEWGQQRREQGAPLIAPEVLSLAAAPLGLVAFTAYLYGAFHDPIAWVRAQSVWRTGHAWFLGTLVNEVRIFLFRAPLWALAPAREMTRAPVWSLDPVNHGKQYTTSLGFDWFVMLVTTAMIALAARRLRWGYIVWAAIILLVPLQTGQTWCMVRFTAEVFPLALAYGFLVKSQRVHTAWIATSVSLLVLATAVSLSGGPIV
jgi:hypothetical protein